MKITNFNTEMDDDIIDYERRMHLYTGMVVVLMVVMVLLKCTNTNSMIKFDSRRQCCITAFDRYVNL